jgi:subfamily B ATP-binding cassette protein MsbA
MTRDALLILFGFARPYRGAIPVLVALGVIASLAEGFGIGLLIPVVSAMLEVDSSGPAGPFAKAMEAVGTVAQGNSRLLLLSALIGSLVALKTLVLVANVRLAAAVNGSVTRDLRVGLCSRLLTMDYGAFRAYDSGRLMNLLDVQTYRTSEALMHAVSLLTAACFLAVFTTLLLLISWQLTLLVMAVAVPVSMFVRYRTRRAQSMADALLGRNASLSGRILELLGAMRTIRIFGQEAAEVERFRRAADEARRAFVRTETTTWTVVPVVELLYVPLFLAVLAYAWFSDLGVPSLLAFLVLLYRMQPQLSRIDYARVSLAGYAPGMRELDVLLRADGTGSTRSGSRRLVGISQGIEFERVGFQYPGADSPALTDVSFLIPRGSVFAIVGRSGSGKSTLLNLLFRLYDPTSGTVRIDRIALTEYELDSMRSVMAFAGQDADLLAGTVRENIAYGATDADQETITKAARDAHADQFIRKLPQGYDTLVGERGLNLSGGQRQRIALARALARRPELLVLDEATNAVDNLTEQAIQATIEMLAGHCTIVIVAHRLNTVRLADHVVVMAGGRVVEEGTPASVIDRGGEFSRMYELR